MKDDVRRDDTILPIACSLWPELAGCRCLLHFHHGTARSADEQSRIRWRVILVRIFRIPGVQRSIVKTCVLPA